MKILVAFASRYGATKEIAERIARKLADAGHEAEARPVQEVGDVGRYDVFVIGSALYFGKWLDDAADFVRRNRPVLSSRPVWLFSSGPLGNTATDAEGRDLLEEAEPRELAEWRKFVRPRDHEVFFGALDPKKLALRDRLLRALPAGRQLLPEGDFRDWPRIEAWAIDIARDLTRAQSSLGEEPAPLY